jgi:hypothetical protein
MKTRTIILIYILAVGSLLSASLSCGQVLSYNRREIKEQIKELSETKYGQQFLSGHSLKYLEEVILFLQIPEKHFVGIQNIEGLRFYIMIYEQYLRETDRYGGFLISAFLEKHFQTIDDVKVNIITYLLLNCSQGIAGEFLSEKFIDLFGSNPDIFINELKKRKDWKEVIRELLPGKWESFRECVNKLGNSQFEMELKKYVSDLDK